MKCPDNTEVVVVGGGLAGGAAAAILAQAGRRVLLFEREAAPSNKICGEFLSAGAQQYLARIGFDLDALGGNAITRLRLVRGSSVAEATLPFRGLGLSRRVLDGALLEYAHLCGADVRRGHVARLLQTDARADVQVDGIGRWAPDALLLATGKHDVRNLRRSLAEPAEDLIGFKTYFRLGAVQTRALSESVEVIVFSHGYAGLQLVENGHANLCLLTDRTQFQQSGATWDGLLRDLMRDSAHLRQRLQQATPLLKRPLTIYRVPYGFVHAPLAHDSCNVYRLGDQAAVIPSFAGDGMAIALHSAALAVQALQSELGAYQYQQRIRADVRAQVARASVLYRFGRSTPGRSLLIPIAQAWPRAMQVAAALTRVPNRAMARVLSQ
ncbi:MAG TPA: NAD(P)-binding protein [Burkholderiaceae bacterium]|nr:NAD(P)-binding protein [Burkholderiaceae bacterium]